ncbi:uncharacterized protein LOC132206015 [Stegostoma tigrinum]|uniref:uncharacterized protein LOC132206015 n=1 Tax=Stegostoma tigrinum TaxID=3053191 RepID=UPI00286FBD9D|nr:uncharacterized protein LOC132206015 [Stegostoma tigrinum]
MAKRLIDSESSVSVSVLVLDKPRKPSISLKQSYGVFVRGEMVNITCSVDFQSSRYSFYLHTSEQRRLIFFAEHRSSFITFQVQAAESDYYMCECGVNVSGQRKYSELSEKLHVAVIERPKMPEIELNESARIFLTGESVGIVCRVGAPSTVRGFYLYKGDSDRSLQQIREPNGSSSVSFQVVVNETGEYRCAYWTIMAKRLIDSESSVSVSVLVLDRRLEPEISLSLNFTTVVKGELLLLTCTAPVQDSVEMFYLYQRENLLDVAPPLIMKGSQTVVFNITETVNPGVQQYDCMYTTLIAERLISSQRSNPVILTIKDHVRKPTCLLEFHDYLLAETQNATMNCTAPIPYPSMTFLFYGISQTPIHSTQVTDGQSSAAFDFLVPRFRNKSVHYSCSYQVDIGERWIESDKCIPLRSDGIFLKLLIILGSGLLLLLLIIILICTIVIVKTGICTFNNTMIYKIVRSVKKVKSQGLYPRVKPPLRQKDCAPQEVFVL